MKKRELLPLVALILFQIALPILLVWGEVLCIYKFVKCDFSDATSYKPEIVYGIGTFTGTGIIIGWMDLGK